MNSMHNPLDRGARPLLATLRTVTAPVHPDRAPPEPPSAPFVTISRQAGIAGNAFAQRLVERFNAEAHDDRLWSAWDRELVEEVAKHHHLATATVAALEERSASWLEEFLSSFQAGSSEVTDELRVYHRVAKTIRALSVAGHVVIVGRGGWFVTRDLPGGVHVRLVAPLDYRVAQAAASRCCSKKSAADWVRQTDRARGEFCRRYGPRAGLAAESFDITLNAATSGPDVLAECILPLVHIAPRCSLLGIPYNNSRK